MWIVWLIAGAASGALVTALVKRRSAFGAFGAPPPPPPPTWQPPPAPPPRVYSSLPTSRKEWWERGVTEKPWD